MAAPVDLGFIGFFLPIFAFLLVMIVVYAILQKTKFLGDNPSVSLFLSVIMASFFIVEVHLVDFVAFTSQWASAFVVLLFLLFLMLAFIPVGKDKDPFEFLNKGNWFSWVVLALMIVFFILSSSYVFNWAINFDSFVSAADNEWFGFLLLIIVGGAVSAVLFKGASSK